MKKDPKILYFFIDELSIVWCYVWNELNIRQLYMKLNKMCEIILNVYHNCKKIIEKENHIQYSDDK